MRVMDSDTKKILHYVALGGGVAVLSLVAPMLPYQLIKAYVRQKRFEKKRFTQDLKRLHARGLIETKQEEDGTVSIKLLQKGKEVVERYRLETIAIARPKKWDGAWRFILFDIPESKKHARHALSAKLRELGFYRLQKSVFVHPFPCEKEVEALGAFFGSRRDMIIMNVSHFDGEEKLRHHFSLS